MEFSYVAVNEKNRKYRNRMTANTKEEVKRKLEQRGLIAISIDEVKKGSQEDIPIWQRDLGGSKDVHTLKISIKSTVCLTCLNNVYINSRESFK